MPNHCQRVKSNTAVITGALDTYYLPEREDGFCAYCQEYNTELGLDGCCVEDKHAMPNELTCHKARKLRAMANAQALGRKEISVADIDPLEGIFIEVPGIGGRWMKGEGWLEAL